jgi:hypothetical protein
MAWSALYGAGGSGWCERFCGALVTDSRSSALGTFKASEPPNFEAVLTRCTFNLRANSCNHSHQAVVATLSIPRQLMRQHTRCAAKQVLSDAPNTALHNPTYTHLKKIKTPVHNACFFSTMPCVKKPSRILHGTVTWHS